MTTLSKDEAITLLSQPLLCEDHDGWVPDRDLPNDFHFVGGLVYENGDRARLVVQILVKLSKQTQIKHFLFSVDRPRPYPARVYQLEIRNCPKALRDLHQWPHEHFGSSSRDSFLEWKDWSFQAAFEHFQNQTNVRFDPSLLDPLALELKP